MMRRLVKAGLLIGLLAAGFVPAASAQDVVVGTYTSPTRTFSTATYWIKGKNSTVLIDTQFLPPESLLAKRAAEAATRQPVSHAVVLHPNPDKFNGTAVLQALGVQVLTSEQVVAQIPAVHQIRLGWFADEFKPDYPKDAAKPQTFGDRTTEVDWSGVKLKLHVLGPGCSAAHVVVQHGDAAFVGDLVNPDNHAWLELGTIDEWLKRLEEIRAMGITRVYPGRGKPGGVELLDKQAEYLRHVQALVVAEQPQGTLGWFAKLKLQREIEKKYPSLQYPGFMRDGLAEVWRVEAGKKARN
jgi:glyoxylase-like metal-dependent hydrolase (beta-lactamase superfamily II)